MTSPHAERPLRRRLYCLLEPSAWPKKGLSPLNKVISVLIMVATVVAVVESEPVVIEGREKLFLGIEAVFTLLFLVEYVGRLWVAGENSAYRGLFGRLKYMTTPSAVIDLLAITPLFLTFLGSEAFLLRLFRLLRILRVARLGRFSQAFDAIMTALRSRRYELMMSVGIAGILLLISSTVLYLVEGEHQPVAFGSIPRAMWWSIATLTTVGYGDVYPQTTPGQIFAGLTALTGIGLIAMPTGILAAAFSDAIQAQRRAQDDENEKRTGRS